MLVLTVGGESYVILNDEETVTENKQKPAIPVDTPKPGNSVPASKPIDVQPGNPPVNAAAAFLQSLNIPVASGSDPRIFVNGKVYHLGETVAPDYGLRWTGLNDQTRQLEFTDKDGHRYIKKF